MTFCFFVSPFINVAANVPGNPLPKAMITTFDEVRNAALHLPGADKARLLSLVAMEVTGVYPGIDFQNGVCGGAARIIRTRIPIWTLEAARRQGMTDAAILGAFPTLTAEDLANAWAYARSHRDEIDREITANEDHS